MDKIHEIFERIKLKRVKNGEEEPFFNAENGYETEHEALKEYFRYERLKWCGCGIPEIALEQVRKFLDAYKDFDNRRTKLKEYFGVEYIYDNPLLLCLAYTLDAAELTEHGSSVGGAWLTKDGEDFLYCMETEEQTEEE